MLCLSCVLLIDFITAQPLTFAYIWSPANKRTNPTLPTKSTQKSFTVYALSTYLIHSMPKVLTLENLPQEIIDGILLHVLSSDHRTLQETSSLAIMHTSRQLRFSTLQYFSLYGLSLTLSAPDSAFGHKSYSRRSWMPYVDILQHLKVARIVFKGFGCEESLLRLQIEDLEDIWTRQNRLEQLTLYVPPVYHRSSQHPLELRPNEAYKTALEPLAPVVRRGAIQWAYDFYSPFALGSSTGSFLAALEDGDPAIVQTMLEKGAKVDKIVDKFQGYPLHVAAWHNHLHVVDLLIQHGADVNAEGGWPAISVLWAAVAGCNKRLVQNLIGYGAHVDASGGYEDRVLDRACYGYPTEIVEELLKGLDNSVDLHKVLHRPMKVAVMGVRFDLVQMILEKGLCVAGQVFGVDRSTSQGLRTAALLQAAGAAIDTNGSGSHDHNMSMLTDRP